jgi:uncharacterized protein
LASNDYYGRLALYVVITFGITWVCWWTLAPLVPAGSGVFASPTFATLYIVGGFGPAVGALLAVAWTPREGSLADYGRSLIRWRVSRYWYVAALLLPAGLALLLDLLAASFAAQKPSLPGLSDLARVPLIFATMILGGGIEELGWRGVAQPTLERRLNRMASAAIVGAIWSLWHLPLFFIHSVAQFGANFPLFAADVMGNAFLLAWIYAGTRSILLCILFHAASNTCATIGLDAWDGSALFAWIGPLAKIVLGALLIFLLGERGAAEPALKPPRPAR